MAPGCATISGRGRSLLVLACLLVTAFMLPPIPAQAGATYVSEVEVIVSPSWHKCYGESHFSLNIETRPRDLDDHVIVNMIFDVGPKLTEPLDYRHLQYPVDPGQRVRAEEVNHDPKEPLDRIVVLFPQPGEYNWVVSVSHLDSPLEIVERRGVVVVSECPKYPVPPERKTTLKRLRHENQHRTDPQERPARYRLEAERLQHQRYTVTVSMGDGTHKHFSVSPACNMSDIGGDCDFTNYVVEFEHEFPLEGQKTSNGVLVWRYQQLAYSNDKHVYTGGLRSRTLTWHYC